MSRILNRRNAMLGWAVWKLLRFQAKRRAARAFHLDAAPRRGRVVPLLVGVATAAGLVFAWRKLRGRGDESLAPQPVDAPRPETGEPTPITSVRDDDIPPAA